MLNLESLEATDPAIYRALSSYAPGPERPMVVKIGGSVGSGETSLQEAVWLQSRGARVIVVHGGGAAISDWLARLGKETHFVEGLRYTDEETLDIVRMVLVGKVNGELVAGINGAGGRALGLSGTDGELMRASLKDPRLGLVGEIESVDSGLLRLLLDRGYIPVIAPIASDGRGGFLNINADTAAGEIAAAVKAYQLVFLTDVPGVIDGKGSVLSRLTRRECETLIGQGVIQGGMLPKVEACLRVAAEAEGLASIVDGRVSFGLLRELLSEQGCGTRIVAE